mmetsp:Transcript_7274/g.25128  ORF Transcript_7274/g.25128 Transcript_7274/m.25128 type:complete len:263 (-) Transcript_7274:17-805(-)
MFVHCRALASEKVQLGAHLRLLRVEDFKLRHQPLRGLFRPRPCLLGLPEAGRQVPQPLGRGHRFHRGYNFPLGRTPRRGRRGSGKRPCRGRLRRSSLWGGFLRPRRRGLVLRRCLDRAALQLRWRCRRVGVGLVELRDFCHERLQGLLLARADAPAVARGRPTGAGVPGCSPCMPSGFVAGSAARHDPPGALLDGHLDALQVLLPSAIHVPTLPGRLRRLLAIRLALDICHLDLEALALLELHLARHGYLGTLAACHRPKQS